MITTTIRELLSDDYVEPGYGPTVYVIRDGDAIFYIGRTTGAVGARLDEHLGLTWRGGLSPVGRFIGANRPESDDWQVDMMSRRDCWPTVRDKSPDFPADGWKRDDGGRASEIAMIRSLEPCLNVAGNANKRKSPGRYYSGEVERDLDPAEGYVNYGEV